jgi:hypothetical protein
MFIWGLSRRGEERAAEWRKRQEAETSVKKAGGIKVPIDALDVINAIIKRAFDNLEELFEKHNIVLNELYLEQIKSFEGEISIYLSSVVRKLIRKTIDYGVLTREQAQATIDEEVNKGFEYFMDFSFKYKFVMSDEAEVAMIGLKREIYFKIFNYIEQWKY